MKSIKILPFLFFISSLHIVTAQSDSIRMITSFIGNSDFVVYEPFLNLDIDTVYGEDLNSITYGKFYKKILKKKYPKWSKKTTIASNEMDIDIIIQNLSSSIWQIESIKLEIIESIEVGHPSSLKKGKWPYSTRAEEDEISFLISGNKKGMREILREVYVYNGNGSDNQLSINVKTSDNLNDENTVIKFSFIIEIVEVGSNNTRIIKSDKSYFIYSQASQ